MWEWGGVLRTHKLLWFVVVAVGKIGNKTKKTSGEDYWTC